MVHFLILLGPKNTGKIHLLKLILIMYFFSDPVELCHRNKELQIW